MTALTRQQLCALETFQPDVAEYLRRVESERDAAIAAKETAEKERDDDAANARRLLDIRDDLLTKMRPIVEAARNMALAFCTREEYPANERLEAALRALDAGEAPVSPVQRDFGLEGDESDYDTAKRLEHAATSRQQEIEKLRSALASAEEEAHKWKGFWQKATAELAETERREANLFRERGLLLEASCDVADLESKHYGELATIVERTAKAQRISDAGLAEKGRDPVSWPLVTLSTLPEADSSGGGEKKCDHDGVPEELCRHCGAQRAAHWNGKYCPKKDSLWGAALTVFDPAPPKSERDEEGHFPGCKTFGCEATACRAEPFLSMAMQRKDNTPPMTAEPKPEAIDEWDDDLCDIEIGGCRYPEDQPYRDAMEAIKRRNASIASDAEAIAELRETNESLHRKVRGAQHCTDEQDEVIAGLRQALESIRSMAADREAFVRRGPMAFAAAVRICEEALKKGPAE